MPLSRKERAASFVLLFLTTTPAARVAAAETAQETVWRIGVKESLDASRKASEILPRILDGRIVASAPKSARLLQYVVEHCKARAGRTDSEYVVVADAGNGQDALTAVGRFKTKAGAAKYTFVLGPAFLEAEKAFVLVTWTAGGARYSESLALEWDEAAQDWKLRSASGEEKFSDEVREIR